MTHARWLRTFVIGAAAAALAGCLDLRAAAVPTPADPGAAQLPPAVPAARAEAAEVPEGYRTEVVVSDLTYPTSVELDDQGRLYVAEAGLVYGDPNAPTRILRVGRDGALEVFADASDGLVPPIMDLLWHQGRMLVSHRGKISILHPDGSLRHLVEGLPSNGDHFNGQLAEGPEGKLYFGQGSFTNAGVVGVDNFLTFSLLEHPTSHDRPARTMRLKGREFTTIDPFALGGGALDGDRPPLARTGAFAPFGREVEDRWIRAVEKPNGVVFRMNPDGTDLEVFAWGFRNPVGLALAADGSLYACENGYDARGSRPIANAPDGLFRVEQDAWYGFPDFAAGDPIDVERFQPEGGPQPEFLLESHPPVQRPVVVFPPHTAPTKLAASPGGRWGDRVLYQALFGHAAPFTGEEQGEHMGHSVVRIDLRRGTTEQVFGPRTRGERDRAPQAQAPRERTAGSVPAGYARGPAAAEEGAESRAHEGDPEEHEHGLGPGPRRPMDVVFARDGSAMYVVDLGAFGVLETPVPLPKPYPGTGVIWRIVPADAEEVLGPPAGVSALPGRGAPQRDEE